MDKSVMQSNFIIGTQYVADARAQLWGTRHGGQ
jgi:hypothetical protein